MKNNQEGKKDSQPTETVKIVVRTFLTGFLVPIVCGLPELMVIRQQLKLRTKNGLLLGKQFTSPTEFLSGVSMGWISGGLKATGYANKELICDHISQIRNHHQDNIVFSHFSDRLLASFLVGGIDATATHSPSTLRALLWTNPPAVTALIHTPLLTALRKIYQVGFTTRLLKSSINASFYVTIAPILTQKGQDLFPEKLSKPLAVLSSGILSGFFCTMMDVIGVHIYKEAVITEKEVKASSLVKMSRELYRQNGLRIFTSGARWNALVSALAFGTMASVEQFVDSELFVKTYQESYRFFKQDSKKINQPKSSQSAAENHEGESSKPDNPKR